MFESMIEKAKDVAGVACNEMEKFTNISSLKLHRINLNRKMSQAYEDLGRVVFMLHQNNETDSKKVEAIIEKIEKLSNELQNTSERIDDIKNHVNQIDTNEE